MFDILYEGNNHFVKAVEYYLSVDTPTRLSASRIVEYLFNLMDPEKVLQLLQANEYTQKNEWIYYYFYHFPNDKIQKNTVEDFYSFLLDDSDKAIIRSGFREITFVKKFSYLDPDVFIKTCKIILKKSMSSRLLLIYILVFYSTTESHLLLKFSDYFQLK